METPTGESDALQRRRIGVLQSNALKNAVNIGLQGSMPFQAN